MNRSLRLALALHVALVATAGLPAVRAAEADTPVQARLTLHNKQVWNVDIRGRFGKDLLRVNKHGEASSIELSLNDIRRIDLPLKLDHVTVMNLYDGEQYQALTDSLHPLLLPALDLVANAESNTDQPVALLLKAYTWSERYPEARALADQILERTDRGRPWLDALVMKTICLVSQNQLDEAVETAAALPAAADDRSDAALIRYTAALVLMKQGHLAEAQEELARLIAYHARDFEWMPAALLLSAEGYARAGQPEVARHIVEEIALNYPTSHWVRQAQELDPDALVPPPPIGEAATGLSTAP